MYDHQFPPTIWQYSSWDFSGVRGAWLVVAIVVAALSLKWHASKVAYLFWPICLAVFTVELLQKRQFSSDPYRQIDPLSYCLNAVVVLTALFAMARTWQHRTGTRYPFESIVLALVVFFGFSHLFYGYSCPPSRRVQCKNNLKQIGLAMHNYHDVHSTFPPATFGTPTVSWRIALLPFIEQEDVYSLYDQTAKWDSSANRPLSTESMSTYDCPQRPVGRERNAVGQFLTSYVAPIGPNTVLGSINGTAIRDITDGTSNTLLIAEACGSNIVWTEPRDIQIVGNNLSVNLPTQQVDYSESVLSSYHTGGAQVVLADGSAHFISENIDHKVLAALLTRDGGETPDKNW